MALHQSRFRTPGAEQDPRGVLLGRQGLMLFGSLDRLVAFLRAYSEEGSLDELIPGLSIQRVTTALRTRELVLTIKAESSYRMDRVAEIARLADGLVFTGTSRHFVQYRDRDAPLGYDLGELDRSESSLILYHSDFTQGYEPEAELALQGLLLRLRPQPLPGGHGPRPSTGSEPEGRILATVEPGLAPALTTYLARNGVPGRVGLLAWEDPSSFTDAGHREAHLFELPSLPPRAVDLFISVPGIALYREVTPGAAVELGHVHPVALDSCASLFDDGGLVLFRGGGPPRRVASMPRMASVSSLLGIPEVAREDAELPLGGGVEADPLGERIPLRLAPNADPPRRVTAVVIPRRQRAWLARVLYSLPPRALAGLRMALSPERIFLHDAAGIDAVPLGRAYAEPTPGVHVPVGLGLVPAVSPEVLAALIPEHRSGHVFFEPGGGPPRFVPKDAFGPVGRVAIAEVAGQAVPAHPPSNADVPLTLLRYEPARTLPLWGAVGRDGQDDPAGGGGGKGKGDDDDDPGRPSGGDDGPGRAVVVPPIEELG